MLISSGKSRKYKKEAVAPLCHLAAEHSLRRFLRKVNGSTFFGSWCARIFVFMYICMSDSDEYLVHEKKRSN